MKPVLLCGNPPPKTASTDAKLNWLLDFAAEVIRNSKTDAMTIATAFHVTNLPATPVRSLNVSTATLTNALDVFGQLIVDLQHRGINNR